jgi:hypothetical protein
MTTDAFPVQGGSPSEADLDDWPQLCEALVAQFPSVPAQTVMVEVARAKQSVSLFGLGPADEIEIGRRIAWNGLLILTGEVPDAARLDPESHLRRRHAAPLD